MRMADDQAAERLEATKDALGKCSETANRAMVSLLAVSLFSLLTTLVTGHRTRAEFERYHSVSPGDAQDVARRIDTHGARPHHTAL
jgi:hypothetical protein